MSDTPEQLSAHAGSFKGSASHSHTNSFSMVVCIVLWETFKRLKRRRKGACITIEMTHYEL